MSDEVTALVTKDLMVMKHPLLSFKLLFVCSVQTSYHLHYSWNNTNLQFYCKINTKKPHICEVFKRIFVLSAAMEVTRCQELCLPCETFAFK